MALTICLLLLGVVDREQERQATNQTRVIEQAMKKYYAENAKWPIQTFDVAKELEDGEKVLIDPWGNPYQYVLGQPEPGVTRPYIWTERAVDGKKKVYGTKPPDVKKNQLAGR